MLAILRARALLLAAVMLLAGCETMTLPWEVEVDEQSRALAHERHLLWLSGIESWKARGRFAARLPDDSVSASMSWEQEPQSFDLRLSGPFGAGSMRIDGTPGAVRLRTSDGRTVLARTPEELVSRELGWQLPVSVLRYWILGRPAPDIETEQLQLDDEGHVQRMFQAGWDVQYKGYSEVEGGALPSRVEVRGPSVELTLLLTTWSAS